jgi:two-component system, NtrC family, response regulator AtoC
LTVVATASTACEQASERGAAVEGFHLLVMAPELCMSHPLPAAAAVVIGRGQDADLVLADALASRRHACLHVAPGSLRIEDLGSANGTRLREQKLPPHEPARLVPGEAVTIGKTLLMVLPNRVPPARHTVLPHDELVGRVAWECARAEATGACFTVLRLHADAAVACATTLAAALRPMDLLGSYGPGHYEVLLPGVDAQAGAALARAFSQALAAAGFPVRLGQASYPRDGRHAHALLARAGAPFASAEPGGAAPCAASSSPAMQQVLALAERAAAGSINVLILGETGAGKEVLARLIHDRSARAPHPFVCVDCAALSAALLESELFGHERGAFTGAGAAKPGLLETAPGGTVFLDEVGELPLPLQAKLLRAIETRAITRVGSVRSRPIDVRFLAATNRDLEAAVGSGSFRRDLYYRLNGMTLTVPPLRERTADIPALCRAFLTELSGGGPPPAISTRAMAALVNHAWPGNVRELRNVIERALLLCQGGELDLAHLPTATFHPPALGPAASGAPASERERILAVLAACGGNQSRAARELGLSRKVLIVRLAGYGVARPRKRPPG